MARAISPFAYPVEFWDIVAGCAQGKEYEREVESPRAGVSIQQKFYAFRTALRREDAKRMLGQSKSDEAQLRRVSEHLAFAERTVCWVDREAMPSKVKFMNQDHHPTAVFLRGFVKKDSMLPPETERELEEAMKALLQPQVQAAAIVPPFQVDVDVSKYTGDAKK